MFKELFTEAIVKDIKTQVSKTRMSNLLKKEFNKDFRIIWSPDDKGYIIVAKDQKELSEISHFFQVKGYNPDNQKDPFYIEIEKNLKSLFESEVNLDRRGKAKDIKVGTMVVVDNQVYKCVEVDGNFLTFEDEDVNQYRYDSVSGEITPL